MPSLSRPRLYEIDLLRFIAALSVLLFHYTFRAYTAHEIPVAQFEGFAQISRYGYLGVELFFMISGFVILLSAHGRSTTDFLRSRALRLYPAFWIGMSLTTLVLLIWDNKIFTVTVWQYLANLTMFHKFIGFKHVDGVYWTLVAEIKFYFLVWLLLQTGAMQNLRKWVWIWLAIAAVYCVTPPAISDRLSSVLIAKWAPFFSVGIACFLLRQSLQLQQTQRKIDWLMMMVAGFLTIFIAATKAADLSEGYETNFSPIVIASIVAGFFACFILIALDWSRFLRFAALAPLGALTYPLYLLHAYIGYTVMRVFGGSEPNPSFVIAVAVVVIALAWLVHRFGEQPIVAWIERKWPRVNANA